MTFLQIETHPAERETPYDQQQRLLATLRTVWDHNAAILVRHGHQVPSDWTGTPTRQEITVPEAVEAWHIIVACCDLWRNLITRDLFAIANAGIWLGIAMSGELFRQNNRRNAQLLRSDAKAKAREVFLSRPSWDKPAQFVQAVRKARIAYGKPDTCRKWLREFEREKINAT